MFLIYTSDMTTSRLKYTSFLIRLWREPPSSVELPTADQGWLVQVEHIPSGEKEYFTSLEDLFAFIRAQLPDPPATKSIGEQERQGGCGETGHCE